MSFEPREYLRHILAEAEYLLEHSRGLDQASFLADQTLRRAFVRSLEIIRIEARHSIAPNPIGKHRIDVIAPTRFRRSGTVPGGAGGRPFGPSRPVLENPIEG